MKFGMQIYFYLLKRMQSLNLIPKVHFRLYGRHIENRYDVITPPPFVRLLQNLTGRCTMTAADYI